MSVSIRKEGDILEVIIRNQSYVKTFHKKVRVNEKKDLEELSIDLKNKGIDLIKIIKNKMITDSDWF